MLLSNKITDYDFKECKKICARRLAIPFSRTRVQFSSRKLEARSTVPMLHNVDSVHLRYILFYIICPIHDIDAYLDAVVGQEVTFLFLSFLETRSQFGVSASIHGLAVFERISSK